MDDFKRPNKKIRLEPTDSFKKPAFDPAHPDIKSITEQSKTNKNIKSVDDIDKIDLSIDARPNKASKQKNKKLLVIFGVILLLLAGSVLVYLIFIKKNKQPTTTSQNTQVVIEKPKPKPIMSPLTGRTVQDVSLTKRPVTAVMIENSPDARPQSGLTDADMVYEAVAEGGITRFMALYQESQPQYIGPVRSVRPYYLDYALPLEASLAHVGGSPEALQDIKTLGVRDLDQFFNDAAYWRITERFAPHNMYTSFERLDKLNQSKNYTSSNFVGLERKSNTAQTPTANSIDLSISGPLYSPHFDYVASTNSYNRSQAGKPHIDLKSGKQISPNSLIVLVVNNGIGTDGYHNSYNTSGTGKVYVFQDGIVSQGTWTKNDRKSPLVLNDSNNLPMKINSGQTWVSLVGASTDIGYKP